MLPDEEGFLQPVVDAAKCVQCGKCEAVCPVLHPGKPRKPLAVYAAKAKDDELRWGSASGGVFTVLAQDVLKRGGVVFGAGFERPTWRVIHKAATNEEELDDLRGSKYVQSDTGDTFKEAKSYLDTGREVLYSGCPCQIAALKSFLGKEYPNLLTVDLICHGVPSPLAWRKYLDCREKEAGGKITRILARRYCVWQEFAISLEFDNSREIAYCKNRWTDPYLISYVSFWGLRTSCLRCGFRGFKSGSDITLGDYNNVDTICQSMDGEKGASAVVVNARVVEKRLECVDVNLDKTLSSIGHLKSANASIYSDPNRSRLRSAFVKGVLEVRFDDLVRMLSDRRQGSFSWHLLWWVKRLFVNREVNKFKWS